MQSLQGLQTLQIRTKRISFFSLHAYCVSRFAVIAFDPETTAANKLISFDYQHYGMDKNLHILH